MSFVVHRVAKSAARYTDAGGREKCAYCRFFVAPRACGKVIGPVSPQGWCKYFSRQVSQQYSGAGITGGGGGPTLSLDFMQPGTLDPRITFTRASTGTYFDSTGAMQTAAINTPRWDYDPATLQLKGLLIEEPRTNLLLNSATLSTQSVTTTATAYTLSFYGTGTITKSGTATGALVGTGAQRVSQTFTPTAGALTLTVTGSVLNAQIEAGSFATSYFPTTGATATRAADVCSMPTSTWFSASASSLLAEYMMTTSINAAPAGSEACSLSDGTAANKMAIRALNAASAHSLFLSTVTGASVVAAQQGPLTAGVAAKYAAMWNGAAPRGVLNGGTVVGYSQALPSGINLLTFGNQIPGGASPLNGHLRRIQYWPRALSDVELRQVTT